ncbi:MAG: glycoside hydrolase family 125 protein [Acidobacteriota bacterium]|nr:glycoside hydrolase family 125 protein [Acidobacteriota bacterium]
MDNTWTRRAAIKAVGAGVAYGWMLPMLGQTTAAPVDTESRRPTPAQRKFHSAAVERTIVEVSSKIADARLAMLFANCFPNPLDTTVEMGRFEGKPDTVVITGDIDAMWLRDASAQVWPYLALAAKDEVLREMLEGVIRRETRCLLIDPYANAFMANLDAPPLSWSVEDKTEMKRGVGERKYELDSLCYPIRLAHGYWKQTGDTRPFDAQWKEAMKLVVATMRVQQRKQGPGPYHFERASGHATDTLLHKGYGNPVKPVGLIASGFRPSDDACVYPFLVPSNLFAVTSLRQLAEMSLTILHDAELANQAHVLSVEVERALQQYAKAPSVHGSIWAYEVDGFGHQLLMDDANVPSLLGLPYLESSPDAQMYERTRAFVWSQRNPWFFKGSAGEGIGGPHEGADMIWPMSQTIYALTAGRGPGSGIEIRRMLTMLQASAAGTGFMHESYNRNDIKKFTRPWFAWANSLFGELIVTLAETRPELLR